MASTKPNFTLRAATHSDLPSLRTVFARSFHPVSPFMQRAIPDTPLVRQWWNTVHGTAMSDPSVRLLVVTDASADNTVAAVGRWRIGSADGKTDAGTWSGIPLSSDHDAELCNAFIDFLASRRCAAMNSRPHCFIELLVVDHACKGQGVGQLLLEQCCREADEGAMECFVETNGGAVGFYQKTGFELRERMQMPGGFGYQEYVLVRQPTAGQSGSGNG